VLVLGEMGIGNSTIAAALACALFGGAPEDWVGPGTGADSAGMTRKAQVIAQGLERHNAARGMARSGRWAGASRRPSAARCWRRGRRAFR
jgi:nicotinate-nucleotide--dimethylbenzimidazole phosphoribosyltransferase